MVSRTLELKGLAPGKFQALEREAKKLGITPERYVKNLVEERLDIAREARGKTFAEISGPGRDVDDAELDKLVEAARERHHRQTRKKK